MAEYAQEVKAKMKKILEDLLKEGIRMSGTTDEWTTANRRFSCVNVHLPGGDSFRLGLIRVKHSMPAERAAEIFREKLLQFGLEEIKMVASTTDGCSGRV